MIHALALVMALTGPGPSSEQEIAATAGRSVSLSQLLRSGDQAAPELQRSRARVSLGAAAVLGARPLLIANPQLQLSIGGRVNPFGINFELQAQVTQRFEIAGERRTRLRAAARRKEALQREATAVAWETEVAVRAAFARALIARAVMDTRVRIAASNRRTADIVRARVSAGDVAELQLRMAEGELALSEQAVVAAATAYAVACRELASTAGWSADATIEPAGKLVDPGPLPAVDELLAALPDHPRIAALKAQREAAGAQQTAADREAWPEPFLGVYYAREQEPGTAFPSRIALGTIGVGLPLFRRNQGERARARADVRVAETSLSTGRYQLEQELRAWHVAADGAKRRVHEYSEAVLPRFAENLDQLGRALELGEIGGLEVVLARQRFADMQLQAFEAWDDYVEATAALERVSGRRIIHSIIAPPSDSPAR